MNITVVPDFCPFESNFEKKKIIFFPNFHLLFIAASNFLKMSYDNAKACAVVETTDTETRSNLIEPPTHHIQTEVTIPKYPEDSHFGGKNNVLEISFGLYLNLEAPSCSYSLGSVQGERPIESDIDCQLKCHKHKSKGVARIIWDWATSL